FPRTYALCRRVNAPSSQLVGRNSTLMVADWNAIVTSAEESLTQGPKNARVALAASYEDAYWAPAAPVQPVGGGMLMAERPARAMRWSQKSFHAAPWRVLMVKLMSCDVDVTAVSLPPGVMTTSALRAPATAEAPPASEGKAHRMEAWF